MQLLETDIVPIYETRDFHADQYFVNAEMMHQIGDASVYKCFVKFVDMDKMIFSKIHELNMQS